MISQVYKMQYFSTLAGAVVLSLFAGGTARAESVTYSFTGKIAILPAPVVPFAVSSGFASYGIQKADAVSGNFTYLTGGTDGSPLPQIGNYKGNLTAMSVVIGARQWSLASAPNNAFVQIDNDFKLPSFLPINPGYFSDKFTVAGDITGPAPVNAIGNPLAFTLGLDFSSQTPGPNPVFTDTSIPSTLTLGAFSALHQGIITHSFFDASNRVVSEGIRFDITSLSSVSAVPEPSTFVMLLAGVAGLAIRARRGHQGTV
jgi:hypothetical protein